MPDVQDLLEPRGIELTATHKALGRTPAHALVLGGDDLSDDLVSQLGAYGASKVFRVKGEEGLAQPVVDAMAKVMTDNGHDYALFGGGLLGFEIGAGLAARLNAGVTMEVTNVAVEGGKLVAFGLGGVLVERAAAEQQLDPAHGVRVGRHGDPRESKATRLEYILAHRVAIDGNPAEQLEATAVQHLLPDLAQQRFQPGQSEVVQMDIDDLEPLRLEQLQEALARRALVPVAVAGDDLQQLVRCRIAVAGRSLRACKREPLPARGAPASPDGAPSQQQHHGH